jgi:hypothetical protein
MVADKAAENQPDKPINESPKVELRNKYNKNDGSTDRDEFLRLAAKIQFAHNNKNPRSDIDSWPEEVEKGTKKKLRINRYSVKACSQILPMIGLD